MSAVDELVHTLQFRQSLGQSYLVVQPRGLYLLVVPTMMTGNPLEPLRRIASRTFSTALESGRVASEPVSVPIEFGRRDEFVFGRPIGLPEATS